MEAILFNKKPLIIFEMANNHMGDMEHALRIIKVFAKNVKNYPEFNFAFKFQFREISTFIHPDYTDRMDLKYIKRFTETALSKNQFAKLSEHIRSYDMQVIATPFDENSVNLCRELGVDIIKVASCSCGDWPLLERIANEKNPIIFSTAGASFSTIDKIVSFFQHRGKKFAIMHCVGEYPTSSNNLQLNQITQLKERYPGVPIGYSTHEDPENTDAIFLAVGKGACIFEKHVAINTEKYTNNAYSVSPSQVEIWLDNARKAYQMLGEKNGRHSISLREVADLRQFQRGVFVKKDLKKGHTIQQKDLFFAWPSENGQMVANDLSKYKTIELSKSVRKNEPIILKNINIIDNRQEVHGIVQAIKSLVNKADVVYPKGAELEISHHYGIDRFYETGSTMMTVVNREYCKKLIVLLPNQKHPEQYHKKKEETFYLIHGDIQLYLNGVLKELCIGDVVTIQPNVLHSFKTNNGCIIEEISSTHFKDDSYYSDDNINKNKKRKTFLKYWL